MDWYPGCNVWPGCNSISLGWREMSAWDIFIKQLNIYKWEAQKYALQRVVQDHVMKVIVYIIYNNNNSFRRGGEYDYYQHIDDCNKRLVDSEVK